MIARRAALLATFGLAAPPALAAPKAEPWPLWEQHDPAATTMIDHAPWGRFLARHRRDGTDGIARVDYRAAKFDTASLETDITRLAAVPVRALNRGEQFAFWVNLYNMLTVRTVLRAFPVASIRNIAISPGWFSTGPWGAKLVTIEGTALSLDDIEHRILRPIWRDPRVHYVVNCAALGCPNLPPAPLTAATSAAMLDEAARLYVNHSRGVAIENGRLVASSIYVWYAADFGPEPADVVRHLRKYAHPDLYTALAHIRQVSADRYDWALNGTG